jgi:hypothetical protein
MTKPIKIEGAALADMDRIEVRVANVTANRLVNRHHMCVACAIRIAPAYVKSRRPEHVNNPGTVTLCSRVCAEALREFFNEMGHKEEPFRQCH